MSGDNKVSVIIPAYNHGRFIGDTIESVLTQSYTNLELIIINDGSTDNTDRVITRFSDDRITYLSRENRGAHVTINQGIGMATGEYISILNSDDIYLPGRLEKCVLELESDAGYSVIITSVSGIDDDGNSVMLDKSPHIEAWLDWYSHAKELVIRCGCYIASFGVNILITTSNYTARKSVFDKVGLFRGLRYAHDWDMLLRMGRELKVGFLQESLLKYRIHSTNTVREADSYAKVRFEVNWLISEALASLNPDVNPFEISSSMKNNHYLDYEVLSLLSMLRNNDDLEILLNSNNPATEKMVKMLS